MKSLELRAALALHDFQLSQDEKVDIGGLFGHLRPWIEGEIANAEIRRARKLLSNKSSKRDVGNLWFRH
jgi:hypothetical protein